MKINRNNYEQYFIDHMDGRLDASLIVEFNHFLDLNPDLKAELESFENIDVNIDESFTFSEKDSLKKEVILSTTHINVANFENYFIASFEGDLSEVEQVELSSFLNLNPALQSQFDLFGISKASFDASITFADKKSLKKYPLLILRNWYKPIGIAASLILLFGIFNILQPLKIENQQTERAAVPTQMLNNQLENFTLNYQYPPISQKAYLISANHTEELIPIEALSIMSTIQLPTKSLIASLSITDPINATLFAKNEYDFLAKELMIKKELLLATFGETNPSAQEKLEKSLWAKTFKKRRRNKDGDEGLGDENKKAKINLWTFASMGIEGFNAVTGSNVNIERKLNKEGERKKYILVNANVETETTDDIPNQ
jgi:hypothetical protein